MKTLPLSYGMDLARALVDIASPKPGTKEKKSDFLVLTDGSAIYIRCLNGRNFQFQLKVYDDLSATSSVTPYECVINMDGIFKIEVRPDLKNDRGIAFVEVRKSEECGCGECNHLIVRIPEKLTGGVIQIPQNEQESGRSGRMSVNDLLGRSGPFSSILGRNPLSEMFGGGEGGIHVVNLGDLFGGGDENGIGLLMSRLRRGSRGRSDGSDPANPQSRRETAGAGAPGNGQSETANAGAAPRNGHAKKS